jgi:glycosyltransferase involved in cell wall biosynthesis
MRVAVFIKNTTLHKSFGGFETQNRALCEGLAKKGHDVTVFTPQKELSTAALAQNGVNYIFVKCIFRRFSSIFSVSPDSWEHRSYEALKKHHEKEAFDIIISQSSWGLGVIKRKKELKIPVISISHGSKMGEVQTRLKSINSVKQLFKFVVDIPHILRAFFITQRQFIHGSDRVVAVSNAVRKQIIDETFVEDHKIEVIHNGIDSSKFHKLNSGEYESMTVDDNGKNDREVQVLYVGRVLREKGLFVLINALAQLQPTNFKLNIIGDGEDFQALGEQVKKLGLPHVVNLAGWQSEDVVISSLQKSDIFVLPSLRVEGFPMTLVEAMFVGLPIIASDIGGNSDAVENDFNGFLVSAGDTKVLSQKIGILINDTKLRNKMSENGRIKAQQMFTLEIMLSKYEKVMQQVLSGYNVPEDTRAQNMMEAF